MEDKRAVPARLDGKKVMVVGMAKSGLASAGLLLALGATVVINDMKSREALGDALNALDGRVIDALGQDPAALLDGLDMIVLSPVISMYKPFAREARARGIEVIGEIELGYRYLQAPLVCITGTNGKTTTTALTGEIFKTGGFTTYVLGNIGLPIARYALDTKPTDVVVAEVAALQLESTKYFHPRACAFLNLTEDHLDRFGTMEVYQASKEMMFANQTAEDFAVLNADDLVTGALGNKTRARKLYFSRKRKVEEGAYAADGNVYFRLNGKEQLVCGIKEILLPGAHNLENALAATALAMCMGVPAEAVRRALMTFKGVEHRIEFVKELNGRRFINDSKGTNPDSTIKAIEAMDRPTVLILGGSEKNSDFAPMFAAFGGRIRAVVAVGATAGRIMEAAEQAGYASAHLVENLDFEKAVRLAYELAEPGDNVLLSPACASYDMFDNFEQRGDVFKQIVSKLK